jgi:ankyrin repeat protein
MDGAAPMHRAAEHGHEARVRLLLEKGAGIMVETRSGYMALLFAAEKWKQRVRTAAAREWGSCDDER